MLDVQDEIVREAQTMRQQLHPNVLPLYTSFVHEQNLWMVMPYVSSGSVLNIIKYAHPEVKFTANLRAACLSCKTALTGSGCNSSKRVNMLARPDDP